MPTDSSTETVVRLTLDFGLLELSSEECDELARCLRTRGRLPGGDPARTAAERLELLVEQPDGVTTTETASETELDAIADAAWEWVDRDGPDAAPDRVLLLLDVLRARHAHD